MISLEKFLENTFKTHFFPDPKISEGRSIKAVLKKSLELLKDEVINDVRNFVLKMQHPSGGFIDRAGNPDMYYTLFGFFLADVLGLKENLQRTRKYAEDEISYSMPEGVHLQCAVILLTELSDNRQIKNKIRRQIRRDMVMPHKEKNEYYAFVNLLASLYTRDYIVLRQIYKLLSRLNQSDDLPVTVIAASLILYSTFKKPAEHLRQKLLDFYDNQGGFRAVKTIALPDLLSTAVSLYALSYTGFDLLLIKPECLGFIDSHYINGGFCASVADRHTDIEYTFYGLLALGSLA